MALNLYTDIKRIPVGMKLVKDNEAFFLLHTLQLLDISATPLVRTIDKCDSCDALGRIVDRYGYVIRGSELSTGCKTALNVLYSTDVCFSLIECGGNAIDVIYQLSFGNVLITAYNIFRNPKHLSIAYNGDMINSILELGKLYEEVWPDAYSPDRNYL